MEAISVSVVIPTYNDACNVPRAVRSALCQYPSPKEIIVVDDGSTDDTADVVRAFGADVTYIKSPNGGAGAARNRGVQEASGNWIAFLDSDDEWFPEKLAWQIELIGRCAPQVSVVYGQMRNIDDNGDVHETWPSQVALDSLDMSLIPYWAGLDMFPPTSTVLARRSSLLEAGLFPVDIRTAEDLDLWLRMKPAGRFVGLPRVVANRFVRAGSLTNSTQAVTQYRRYLEVHARRRSVMRSWASRSTIEGGRSYIHVSMANSSRLAGRRWSSIVHAFGGMLYGNPRRGFACRLFLEGCLGSVTYGHLVEVWRFMWNAVRRIH
jgi:glycosyltransferase involved in cell wall biosynthesis